MIRKYAFLNLSVRLLQLKKRALFLLPFKKIAKSLTRYDMFKILNLKSRLQKEIIRFHFGGNVVGILFNSYNGNLIGAVEEVEINNALGFYGFYDKDKLDFLNSIVKKTDCVYIIGAHIGTLTIPISLNVKGIVAFEANPDTFQILQLNIFLSQAKNIQALNYGVFDKDTEVAFYSNKVNSGGSKIVPKTDHFIYTYDNPEIVKVRCKALDDIVKENSLEDPDILIMDIEGAEYAALKGAKECLQKANYLYIEFVPHHLINVLQVSLTDFVEVIIPHFPNMKIVDEHIRNRFIIYTEDKIISRLSTLYYKGVSVDLLFYK